MKIVRYILVAVVIIITGAAGYIYGRRDGLIAQQRNDLQLSSTVAALLRENRSDLALRVSEQVLDYTALDLKRSCGFPNAIAVLDDLSKQHSQDVAFQRASWYLGQYPHPEVSSLAVAYIQAQPK